MSKPAKTIHYSRDGYEGNYSYKSVCGKTVKTHQDNEESTIYPGKANCAKCLATKQYKADTSELPAGMKTRIYIESDFLHADEYRTAQREAADFVKSTGSKYVDRVFSQVLDLAWHDLGKTWQAVKNADEIYATSSFMPLIGGDPSTGAPAIFNGMCERAIKEKITGKKVIILNSMENIDWDYIDLPLMKKAFKKNELYMYDENSDLVKVDVTKVNKKK